MDPFYKWGSTASRLQSYYEEAAYFQLNKLNDPAPILEINMAPFEPIKKSLTKEEKEHVCAESQIYNSLK